MLEGVPPWNLRPLFDVNFFFYRYIITHTFKQHKNTITRYKYIGSTWEKHKKEFPIKELTKNN